MNKNMLTIRNIVIGQGRPKICVPILGETKEEMIQQGQMAANSIGDIIEVRIDYFRDVENETKVEKLLTKIRTVIGDKVLLLTYRTKEEGGEGDFSIEQYHALLKAVARMGMVDIIDVEGLHHIWLVESLVREIHSFGVKVIISHHNFHKTPSQDEILFRLTFMETLGGDLIKMAVMPHSFTDVGVLLDATKDMVMNHSKVPVVTMSMGALGVSSRVLGEVSKSSITFACLEKTSAPGQIPLNMLSEFLDSIHSMVEENRKRSNICLIGFMGTGKSAVARELVEKLRYQLIDMDDTIAKKENRTINEIFENYGEDYFRDLETNLLKEIIKLPSIIISCGGGVVIRKENIKLMRENSVVVLLKATPNEIYQRVKNNKERPLLKKKMNLEYIEELLKAREEYYMAAADIIIDTDHKDLFEIREEILSKLK